MLLLTLLGFMGIGGVVLASFTQQARQDLEERKYQHNQQVLQEAKQALLMFAYNYPQTNPGIGPGRLPCPDRDNDGFSDLPPCNVVGRFPWRDSRLDIPQQTVGGVTRSRLLDASGETLWYAVSDSFDNVAGGGVINSDTQGNITLLDRGGQILYDGRAAGLAAVIIAPGERLQRDNDQDGSYEYQQVRTLDNPDKLDPANYLDTYTIVDTVPNPDVVIASYDNSIFSNNEFNSDDDPLILGPIYDPLQNEYVVNDQMIIITAEEVIEMAEKAVLETYREAIVDYQQAFAGTPYPWLSAYDNTSDLNIYDARPGETTGRVPFLNYYTDYDSHTAITDLQIDFDITLNYTSMVDNADPFDPTYIDEFATLFTGFPGGLQTVTITRSSLSFRKINFDGLADIATDNLGTIVASDDGTATVTATPNNVVERYFWDGCPDVSCIEPANGWELCPFIIGDGRDCAKDDNPPYNFEPFSGDWSNHADISLRLVRLTLEVDPDFVVELNYNPIPAIALPAPPGPGANANFVATFNATEVPNLSVADAVETNLRNFIDITPYCDQDNFVGGGLNLYDLGNEDGGTILCAVNLDTIVTHTLNNQFIITADWYPQLPRWVADNNWDDAVMMSFVPDFAPGGDGLCAQEDGDTATGAADDCLVISNLGGTNNDIEALLVIAGEHDFLDGDDLNFDGDYTDPNEVAPNGDFSNDLYDIFEPENYSNIGPDPVPNNDPTPASDTGLPRVFDKREQVVPGNAADTVFVIN